MKRLMISICLLVTSVCCSAQLFNYRYYEGLAFLEPTFENNPVKGKKDGQIEVAPDQEKSREKINLVALKFLSKEVIDYCTQKRGSVVIKYYVSPIGDVLYMKFMISKKLLDQNLITEEQLKGMYDCYKQIKWEVSKFNPEEDFDFGTMTGPAYYPN